MATVAKDTPATVEQLLQPKPAAIDLDAHRADMARRRAEQDANREEMLKCCNPAYAAKKEYEKPVYEWTVTAEWFGGGDDGLGKWGPESMTVRAQDEATAWAMFCDKIQQWPSPRDAKRTIKRCKKISTEDTIAAAIAGPEVDAELPHYNITPKKKSRKT